MLTYRNKINLYKTLIRPVLIYASETWVLRKQDATFERKILRTIYGAVKQGNEWRVRYNQELYDLYRYMDVIKHITVGRLKWAGHLMMMSMG
jgi:hypothetical protein